MSDGTIFGIIVVAIFAYGFWRGWKQLTNGEGFLANRLPKKAKVWLNQKKAGSIVAKIGISCVLAYVFAAIAFVMVFFTLIKILLSFCNSMFK